MNQETQLELPEGKEQELVLNVIKNAGIKNPKITCSAGSKKGDNYMGVIYRVTAQSEIADEKDLKLIIKCSKRGSNFGEALPSREAFLREIFLYKSIHPTFKKFQEDKSIPQSEQFTHYPKCFATCEDTNDEFLIFEDLKDQRFTMTERMETLNLNHCRLVIEKLAKYHALSFAYKDQFNEQFKELAKNGLDAMIGPAFSPNENEGNTMKKLIKTVLSNAMKVIEDDAEYYEKLQHFYDTKDYEMYKISKLGELEKYTVWTHGDCWSNNILFLYDQEDQKQATPVDVRFLDWQISCVSSPIIDLSYFIYNCTDKTFRQHHFEDLLEFYYSTISKTITQLGSDPEKVFPHHAFRRSVRKYFQYGVAMAMVALQFVTSDASEAPDFVEFDEKDMDQLAAVGSPDAKNYEIYKTRVGDVIRHGIDNGFI